MKIILYLITLGVIALNVLWAKYYFFSTYETGLFTKFQTHVAFWPVIFLVLADIILVYLIFKKRNV